MFEHMHDKPQDFEFGNQINEVYNYYNNGNYVEAFSRGIVLQEDFPNNPSLHNLIGAAELALGDPKAAANSFGKAIEIAPEYLDSYNNLGSLYRKLGMKDEALAIYKIALKINDKEPRLYFNIGNLLMDAEMYDMARDSFLEAIEIDPDHYDAHYNLALSVLNIIEKNNSLNSGKFIFSEDESNEDLLLAEKHFRYAGPGNHGIPEYHNYLGEIQLRLEKVGPAEKSFKKAISLNKDFSEPYVNLARIRSKERNYYKAKELCESALKMKADLFGAKVGLAWANFNLSKVHEAIKIYRDLTREDPGNLNNEYNLGLSLAAAGNFREAWPLVENRFKLGKEREQYDRFSVFPMWDGKESCRLALWQEQGVGDIIFFASTFNDVLRICSDVTVYLDERLIELFEASFPKISFKAKDAVLSVTDFDAQLPVGNLMGIFRNELNDFPSFDNSFMNAFKKSKVNLEKLLKRKSKLKCGIAWYTSADERSDCPDSRGLDLKKLVQVFDGLDIDLINLQYPVDHDKNSSVSKSLKKKVLTVPGIDLKDDFASTAALVDSCDLIVTIDNTIAHLASALGKKTIVLLPLAPPNFRWMAVGENTPFYPDTTTILRKSKIDDWSDVLKSLKNTLKSY